MLAFGTDVDVGQVGVWERGVGSLLDPTRPGSVMEVVNAVSREVGGDAGGWRVDRLLSMVAGLEREARERESRRGGDGS